MADKKMLEIVCEELACVPVGMGVIQNIIFNPTGKTLATLSDALRTEDAYYVLQVTDNGGVHVSSRMQRIVKTRRERGVVMLTTVER